MKKNSFLIKKKLHKWADDICKNYDELIRIMRASA